MIISSSLQSVYRRLSGVLASLDGERAVSSCLAAELAELLEVEHLLIARISTKGRAGDVTPLAFWSEKDAYDCPPFAMHSSPFALLLKKTPIRINSDASFRFHRFFLFEELNISACIAVPIIGPQHRFYGFITVMSSQSFAEPQLMCDLLKMIAHCIWPSIACSDAQEASVTLGSSAVAKQLLEDFHKKLVHVGSEQALLDSVCQLVVDSGRYGAIWIGFKAEGSSQPLMSNASAVKFNSFVELDILGDIRSYLNSNEELIGSLERGERKIVSCVSVGSVEKDFLNNENNDDLRHLLFLPIKRSDSLLGVMVLCARKNVFMEDELELLSELSDGVAFGVSALRDQASQERIKQAVLQVSLAVSERNSDEFLGQLTEHMSDALSADVAFIARLNKDDITRADTLAVVIGNERQANFTYTLPGSPCEEVLLAKECILLDGAGERLPIEGREALSWVRSYAGRRLDNQQGEPIGLIGIMNRQPIQDTALVSNILQIFASGVSAELDRQLAEDNIWKLAFTDAGTGLPNRTAFMQRLDSSFEIAQSNGGSLGLILLDLNHFKEINDTQGHDVGDKVLKSVADLFAGVKKSNEFLARLGGDEFVVLVENSELIDIKEVADVFLETLHAPLYVQNAYFELSASVGVARFPEHASNARELLKFADIAMYQAKKHEQSCFIFDSKMGETFAYRLELTKRLSHAIQYDGLHLAFQPQVCIKTGKLDGVEVLCRWQDPELGFISPDQFIPLAEERGLISALGEWVLNATFKYIAKWQSEGVALPSTVAINVASKQFEDIQLAPRLLEKCRQYGINPNKICIELTESGFMDDPEQAVNITKLLNEQGFSLAIDDFGTGYSALSYLNRFSVDKLKIDMSFVQNMLCDDKDFTLVETIIAMGRNLGMYTLAEGVETEEQARALLKMGCDGAQGYLYSKPVSEEDFVRKWLLDNKS
ncbi:EAL domain-containing protein [Halomonas sp. LY9]